MVLFRSLKLSYMPIYMLDHHKICNLLVDVFTAPIQFNIHQGPSSTVLTEMLKRKNNIWKVVL